MKSELKLQEKDLCLTIIQNTKPLNWIFGTTYIEKSGESLANFGLFKKVNTISNTVLNIGK